MVDGIIRLGSQDLKGSNAERVGETGGRADFSLALAVCSPPPPGPQRIPSGHAREERRRAVLI